MKTTIKILAIAFVLLFSSESFAQWGNKKVVGNGNVTTKSVTTSDYDGVKAVGSLDVHLERGTEGNITVKTDDNLQEYVIIEVKDNTLVVRTKKNMYLKSKKGIHVTVPFTDISSVALVGSGDVDSKDVVASNNLEVSVTGSGDIILEAKAVNVSSNVTGSGDITLSGTTTNLEVTVTGSGDFAGGNLIAENTEAKVSGSGDAVVYAKSSLRARVSGSGDIEYKGNPEKRDTKVAGSGDISGY